MKKKLIVLILFFTFNAFSQITYQKGYFVNNQDQKTECLIKNKDWKNNPSSFEYKLSESDKSKTADIRMVKEFAINNVSKYVRKSVMYDEGSQLYNDLTYDRNPEFVEKQLFLKALIEGNAYLYSYEDSNSKKFFFNIENNKTEQLVYKKYKISENRIKENNYYKQQLSNNLKCESIKSSKFETIEYKKKDLIKLFNKYNVCQGGEDYFESNEKQKNNQFRVTLRPRLNNSSAFVGIGSRKFDFDDETSLGFGVELEQILNVNNGKWSIIFEPTYQTYKSEAITDVFNAEENASLEYNAIQLPFGIRHYFFLSADSKLFINASASFDLALSNSRFNSDVRSEDNDSLFSFLLGAGYNYKKYNVEIRYQPSRSLYNQGKNLDSEFSSLSFILGYRIL